MSNRIASAGYSGGYKGTIFAPDRIASKIVLSYQECALMPFIAKSDFISTEELMCGGKVIYGVEQPVDLFGSDRQNNEHPEVFDGPGIDTCEMTICQGRKFAWKLSNYDRRIMCDNFDLWEQSVRRRLETGIRKLIDSYSIAKVMASASPDNVGNAAGRISHSIDLGWQDATALNCNTEEGLEELFYKFHELAMESGWNCGMADNEGPGETNKTPVILIPVQLHKWAVKILSKLGAGCCVNENALITGKIGKFMGFDVMTTTQLRPAVYGAAGRIAPILMLDPTQVLHAFEVIETKWYEREFEWVLVGEFVWDTHVVRPEAIAVAFTKI